MKTLIFSAVLCCAITLPAIAELTDDDLNKIRLIVKEEVKSEIKAEIAASEIRMKEHVNTKFEGVDKQFASMDKRITDARNLGYALIALIGVVIGIPAWQNRRDRDEKKKIEELTQRLEALEQQSSVGS